MIVTRFQRSVMVSFSPSLFRYVTRRRLVASTGYPETSITNYQLTPFIIREKERLGLRVVRVISVSRTITKIECQRCSTFVLWRHYMAAGSWVSTMKLQLTPWNRVLPEKLTSYQLVKRFNGTRWFITAFKSTRHNETSKRKFYV